MDWFKRAADHGAGIVARVLTQQYINSMKALGLEAIYLVTEKESPGCSNWKVYCHEEYCIVDANETGIYMVHHSECPLYEFAPFNGKEVTCKVHKAPFSHCRGEN